MDRTEATRRDHSEIAFLLGLLARQLARAIGSRRQNASLRDGTPALSRHVSPQRRYGRRAVGAVLCIRRTSYVHGRRSPRSCTYDVLRTLSNRRSRAAPSQRAAPVQRGRSARRGASSSHVVFFLRPFLPGRERTTGGQPPRSAPGDDASASFRLVAFLRLAKDAAQLLVRSPFARIRRCAHAESSVVILAREEKRCPRE